MAVLLHKQANDWFHPLLTVVLRKSEKKHTSLLQKSKENAKKSVKLNLASQFKSMPNSQDKFLMSLSKICCIPKANYGKF
jgi:hypothetical protein